MAHTRDFCEFSTSLLHLFLSALSLFSLPIVLRIEYVLNFFIILHDFFICMTDRSDEADGIVTVGLMNRTRGNDGEKE